MLTGGSLRSSGGRLQFTHPRSEECRLRVSHARPSAPATPYPRRARRPVRPRDHPRLLPDDHPRRLGGDHRAARASTTRLHFSPTGLSWVQNAYTLTFGGLLLLGARAGDILGRRRVFVAGIAPVHRRLARRRARPVGRLAARRPRRPGRRRRDRRAVDARAADTPSARAAERTRAHRLLQRRGRRRRQRRPGARRHADRVGLLALGAVHQRPDRHRADLRSRRATCRRPSGAPGRFDLARRRRPRRSA